MIQDYGGGWKEGASAVGKTRPAVLVVVGVVVVVVVDGKAVADVVVEAEMYAVGGAFAAGEEAAWEECACATVAVDEATEGALVWMERKKA